MAERIKGPQQEADLRSLAKVFEPLLASRSIQGEVHLRLGHTHLRLGQRDRALEHFGGVEPLTNDPFLKYLSRYFTGRARQEAGDRGAAINAYRAALQIVPRAESAALALAALTFTSGAREDAFAAVEGALAGRDPVDDPWRVYYVGDFRFWRDFIDLLRKELNHSPLVRPAVVHRDGGTLRRSIGRTASHVPFWYYTSVSVNVSVRAGNVPVTGLTAADFVVTDSGVRQTIENVSVEAVPIDVTLILDTSGSAARAIGRLIADARTIAGLLRRSIVSSLLSIDTYVNQLLPLQPAANITWPAGSPSTAQLVDDALVAGMIAPVDIDRRHLIVALTDGVDTTSVLDAGDGPQDVASRSEAVLHIVHFALEAAAPPVPRNWLAHRDSDLKTLTDAAERTGGLFHMSGNAGDGAVAAVLAPSSRTFDRATCCATRPRRCGRPAGMRST